MLRQIIGWLTIKDNREAMIALLTAVSTVLGGAWFAYDRFSSAGSETDAAQVTTESPTGQQSGLATNITINYNLSQHAEKLGQRAQELYQELEESNRAQAEIVIRQIEEIQKQFSELERSFVNRKGELEETGRQLERLWPEIPQLRLDDARAALSIGDTVKADALFAEAEERGAAAERAVAAFERGRLAETDVRWQQAAEHYSKAAQLDRRPEYTSKAKELSSKTVVVSDSPALVPLSNAVDERELVVAALSADQFGGISAPPDSEGLAEPMQLAKGRFNIGIERPTPATLREFLGEPRESYSDQCQPVTNPRLIAAFETRQIGSFKLTMLRPALDSFQQVMDRLKTEEPDIFAALGTAGALCARHVRGAPHTVSSHAWGAAVDLTLSGNLDMGDSATQFGLVVLAEFFNDAGWYWGGREDSMHFEVGEALLRQWVADGRM